MTALTPPIVKHAVGIHSERPSAIATAGVLLERVFARKPAPAMSAAVAKPDGILWSGTSGFAHLELAASTRTDTLFPLGSISKVVTATLAARLALRSALDLDASISATLPGLPAQHRNTTLRQLFNHQAGIRPISLFFRDCRPLIDTQNFGRRQLKVDVVALPFNNIPQCLAI